MIFNILQRSWEIFLSDKKSMVFIETIYIVLSVAILFTYIIPLIYTWLNMDFFTYVNAWDEETYLTYQGAIGSLKSPGYTLGAALTLLFQYLGLSGSVQNLLFDLILIPLMVFFFVQNIYIWQGSKRVCFCFGGSDIVCFCTIQLCQSTIEYCISYQGCTFFDVRT